MSTLFLMILFIGVMGNVVWYSWRYGITPTPTTGKVTAIIKSILPKKLSGNILELGSGWGHLVFALSEIYPHCKVIGYEISPLPYFVSCCWKYWKRLDNVHLLKQDFLTISFRDASLIVCYLYPGAMQRLKAKFESELQPGTYILSHTFAVPSWKPIQTFYVDDLYRTPVFLYQF